MGSLQNVKMEKVPLGSVIQHQLRCDNCLNYLSVGPVMVSANRKTLCGRCVPTIRGKVSLTESLYNVLAEYCYFVCVNHYDGCEAVLGFQETKSHEAKCKGKQYSCLFCNYKAPNGSQMAWHYDKYHPENVIKDHTFKLPSVGVDKPTELIYFNKSNMLSFKISVDDSGVDICARYLNELSKNEKYHIALKKNACSLTFDARLTEHGKEEECFTVGVEKLKQHFSDLHDILCKVKLGNEKVSELEHERTFLITQRRLKEIEKITEEPKGTTVEAPTVADNPTNDMVTAKKDNKLLKIRYLKNGHESCAKCGQKITTGFVFFCFDSSYCEKCFKSDGVSYAETDHLKSTIQCPCEQTITVLDCHKHKRVCGLREYRCAACELSLTFDQLQRHWHAKRPLVLNSPLTVTKEPLDVLWGATGELFEARCSWTNSNKNYAWTIKEFDLYEGYNCDIYFDYEELSGQYFREKSIKLTRNVEDRIWTASGSLGTITRNLQLRIVEIS